jgi:hypothetical protein
MRTDIIFNSLNDDIEVLVADDNTGLKFTHRDFDYFLVNPNDDPTCMSPTKNDIMSMPHSTSFLDLNGDCMPDIFMQKRHREGSSIGQEIYTYYTDIFVARNVDGNQLYCLQQANHRLTFIEKKQSPVGTIDAVPMITFADMDADGMTDLVFYNDAKIYVYYNKLSRREWESSLGEVYLCLT